MTDIASIAQELRHARAALAFSKEVRRSLGGKGQSAARSFTDWPLRNIDVRASLSAVRGEPGTPGAHASNYSLDRALAELQTETLADTLLLIEQRLEGKIKHLADALVIAAAEEARP